MIRVLPRKPPHPYFNDKKKTQTRVRHLCADLSQLSFLQLFPVLRSRNFFQCLEVATFSSVWKSQLFSVLGSRSFFLCLEAIMLYKSQTFFLFFTVRGTHSFYLPRRAEVGVASCLKVIYAQVDNLFYSSAIRVAGKSTAVNGSASCSLLRFEPRIRFGFAQLICIHSVGNAESGKGEG